MTIRLFPVKLQGKDSSEVESLPSYVFRLAFEHGMYVGEFIRFVYKNTIHSLGHQEDFPKLPDSITIEELSRPNKTTRMLLQLFQKTTGEELKSSTLWFLNGNLGRSAGEVCNGFRWCPECFSEMTALGQQPYMKLIWHMSALSHCPIHKTPLVNKCSKCQCEQRSYILKYPFGKCQSCGEKLITRVKPLKRKERSPSWQTSGSDLLELLSDLAIKKNRILPENGVQKSISYIFDYYWEKNREDEFYQLLSRDELLAIIHKQSPVCLKTARRLAFKMGMSLYTLMTGNAHNSTAVLNFEWYCQLPAAFEGISNNNKRNHQLVTRKLQKILSDENGCPSLKEVARKIKVSVGYLEYRFPALVSSIVTKHQELVEHNKLRQMYYAQSYALSFFVSEKYGYCKRSKRQSYRVLREETDLPKRALKVAIQRAYSALN